MMSELVFYLIFLMIENWLNLIQNEAFLCYFYIVLSSMISMILVDNDG